MLTSRAVVRRNRPAPVSANGGDAQTLKARDGAGDGACFALYVTGPTLASSDVVYRIGLDGDVAIFEIGYTGFILQNLYDQKWAEHTMMQLLVDDLDTWWAHIESLDLPAKFGVPTPKPPAIQPWGMRIAYLIDPAGILWHIAQRPSDAPAD